MTAQQYRQTDEDRSRLLIPTFVGIIWGALLARGHVVVWWHIVVEIILGVFCHFVIRNQRVHFGSWLLALLGSGLLGIAAGTIVTWLNS